MTLMLAGLPVSNELVHEIASRLRDLGDDNDLETAEVLETALSHGRQVVALTPANREAIISVLDEPPDGFAELRGVLLHEHTWRLEQGL